MLHLADRLAAIPGVVAVALGGSRACGTERPDSDWDFALYYRASSHEIRPDDVRALGWPGTVSAPHEWGRIVNGGAWLDVDGTKVDLLYRDLDEIDGWCAAAEAGRFAIDREVGYVAGIATYVPMGELALGRVLAGTLPRVAFPSTLRRTAPRAWRNLAAGALVVAGQHASGGDAVGCAGNLAQGVLAAAQARMAERGEWVLNEKRLVERAGLEETAATLVALGDTRAALQDAVARVRDGLALPHWGR